MRRAAGGASMVAGDGWLGSELRHGACPAEAGGGPALGAEIEKVRNYCMSDVAQTAGIFLRTQLLDAATYARTARKLLTTIESEPRLAPMLPRAVPLAARRSR